MEIRRVRVDELHRDPNNARRHDDRNLSTIAGSLKEFGQVEPLVVQKGTGKVIGGNGRLAAMIAMGQTECDIVEVDLDRLGAIALGIMLNRSGELASWEDTVLAETLEALRSEPGFNIAVTGFDDAEVDALLAKLTDAAAGALGGAEDPGARSTRRPSCRPSGRRRPGNCGSSRARRRPARTTGSCAETARRRRTWRG